MTENDRHMLMFGCSVSELIEAIQDSKSPLMGGPAMLAMSMLSDAQELLAMDATDRSRQMINRAKYVISNTLLEIRNTL